MGREEWDWEGLGRVLFHERKTVRGLSVKRAAEAADVSETLWWETEKAKRSAAPGVTIPPTTSDENLRKVVESVGIGWPEALGLLGRHEEAEVAKGERDRDEIERLQENPAPTLRPIRGEDEDLLDQFLELAHEIRAELRTIREAVGAKAPDPLPPREQQAR